MTLTSIAWLATLAKTKPEGRGMTGIGWELII